MKKQVSSPFIVFVLVIPDGITHYFLTLTNKQTCLPFEFVIEMIIPKLIHINDCKRAAA